MKNPTFHSSVIAAVLTLSLTLAAQANVVIVDGAFTPATSTFQLASGNISADNPLELYQGIHPYSLFSFKLDQAGTITFSMNGQASGGTPALGDPALLIFQGLIPAGGYKVPTSYTYVGGNDDIVSGNQRNSLVSLNVAANTPYTIVLTTWQSDLGVAFYGPPESQYGAYHATFTALSGTISPIPEPSTYALWLGLATVGLVGWRRWRSASKSLAFD